MTISRWLLQVYEMSNLPAQESAVSILSAVPDLHVDARSYERGDFLIVDCPDTNQAMTVYELMLMAASEPNSSIRSPAQTKFNQSGSNWCRRANLLSHPVATCWTLRPRSKPHREVVRLQSFEQAGSARSCRRATQAR